MNTNDNRLEVWNRFNDIKIREILKVEAYQKEPIKTLAGIKKDGNVNQFSRFTYFYLDNQTICTGFIISTIDGKICIPVLSMEHIRMKTQIKNQIITYLPHFEKRKRLKISIYLLYYTNLPIEIIQKISKF